MAPTGVAAGFPVGNREGGTQQLFAFLCLLPPCLVHSFHKSCVCSPHTGFDIPHTASLASPFTGHSHTSFCGSRTSMSHLLNSLAFALLTAAKSASSLARESAKSASSLA